MKYTHRQQADLQQKIEEASIVNTENQKNIIDTTQQISKNQQKQYATLLKLLEKDIFMDELTQKLDDNLTNHNDLYEQIISSMSNPSTNQDESAICVNAENIYPLVGHAFFLIGKRFSGTSKSTTLFRNQLYFRLTQWMADIINNNFANWLVFALKKECITLKKIESKLSQHNELDFYPDALLINDLIADIEMLINHPSMRKLTNNQESLFTKIKGIRQGALLNNLFRADDMLNAYLDEDDQQGYLRYLIFNIANIAIIIQLALFYSNVEKTSPLLLDKLSEIKDNDEYKLNIIYRAPTALKVFLKDKGVLYIEKLEDPILEIVQYGFITKDNPQPIVTIIVGSFSEWVDVQ